MLERFQATGFRNLQSLEWRLAPGAQLLLGDNGAGKTSLLEAVYLLATTRSFRTSQIADCLRHGADRFDLLGEVRGVARCRLEFSLEEGQRLRRLNGSETSLAEHLAVLPAVAWTARDGELISGSPEARRRFLDRGVIGLGPRGLEVVGKFRKVLAQKRQILLRGQDGLEVWNELLATCAAELMERRLHYVNLVA
ncbi:MAG: AAA family ATPase, partial [Acidobacteria bacterium]|nr:AAA family ATPase [Acidobacteriota bacterium]